jgi:hypothetical protein
MKQERETYREMRSWLSSHGLSVSESALREQFREWGFVNSTIPITDELVDRVKDLFLHTQLSDAKIASKATDSEGRQLTPRQVKNIRLQHGLKRRVQKADPQETFAR